MSYRRILLRTVSGLSVVAFVSSEALAIAGVGPEQAAITDLEQKDRLIAELKRVGAWIEHSPPVVHVDKSVNITINLPEDIDLSLDLDILPIEASVFFPIPLSGGGGTGSHGRGGPTTATGSGSGTSTATAVSANSATASGPPRSDHYLFVANDLVTPPPVLGSPTLKSG